MSNWKLKQGEWMRKLGRYVRPSEIDRLENPGAYTGMKLPKQIHPRQLRISGSGGISRPIARSSGGSGGFGGGGTSSSGCGT